MREMWVREVLAFGGAVVGAVWGYFLGRAVERRFWMSQLGPGIEAMDRVMTSLTASVDFIRNACDGITSLTRGGLVRSSSSSPEQ